MIITKERIVSKLVNEPISMVSADYPICHICLQPIEEGYCFCDEPVSNKRLTEAADWLVRWVCPLRKWQPQESYLEN